MPPAKRKPAAKPKPPAYSNTAPQPPVYGTMPSVQRRTRPIRVIREEPPRPPAPRPEPRELPVTKPREQTGQTRRAGEQAREATGTASGLVSKLNRGNSALMAEFITIMVIIIIRALADYVPADDESQPGDESPPKGLGPLPLAVAAIVTWFILALVASTGRRASQISVAFGALLIVALLGNSSAEMGQVSTWFGSLGDWNPAPPQAQQVTPLPSGSSSSTGGGSPVKKSKTGGQWWVIASGKDAGTIVQSQGKPSGYGSARIIGPLGSQSAAQTWIKDNLLVHEPVES